MHRLLVIRRLAVAVPLVITIVLWLATKAPDGWPSDLAHAASEIFGLLALVLFAMVMLISARNRTVERLYGGLDKSYALHGQLAKVGWGLMLAHPFLLIPGRVEEGYPWWSVLVPFGPWPEGFEVARAFGVVSYYLFIALVLVTLWRRVDYQHWLLSHKLMGPAFLAAVIHTYLASSGDLGSEPLTNWIALCNMTGILSWVYKVVAYPWAAQRYGYVVEELRTMGSGIHELRLRPRRARMNYEPGEFVFLSVRGNPLVPQEVHPFSMSSTPNDHQLRFSYREVGDYTRKLHQVRKGDEVMVYGPYGEFTSYVHDEYKRQVWIGGGIGIAPFLSMLAHEASNGDNKQIWLFYCAKVRTDLVYDAEIRSRCQDQEDQLHYFPVASNDEGFLTAERILAEVGDPAQVAFLICGPTEMMHSLKRQLVARGVSPGLIHFEEFNFV